MMHAKAAYFGDDEVAAGILQAPHPYAAKQLGRRVRGVDEAAWTRVRKHIVFCGWPETFCQNAEECDWLLGCGAGRDRTCLASC